MGVLSVLLITFLLFPACQTYQIGGALEPRENGNAQGVFFGGDFISENLQYNFVYFPEAHPQAGGGFQFQSNSGNYGLGIDMLYKYPFSFAGNHFSVFPMLGLDMHYFKPYEAALTDDDYTNTPGIGDFLGIGVKIGVGFDISFTPALFLRAGALYSPEFVSFMQNEPGFRFNVAVGYRTKDDKIREGFKTFREQRQANALKNAKENFDKKNYGEAAAYYEKAIQHGATLGNAGVTNLATSLYERGKQNMDKGNYRQALNDFNESMRRQYFMTRQKYSEWKDILRLYEETYHNDAPHGGYGKLIFPANDNLTIGYEQSSNGQTDPNEIKGGGWNLNMLSGQRVFNLAYDEVHHSSGYLKSDSTRVTLDVEEGHIYQATGNVLGSNVIIRITDVTNSELGKNLNINPSPVFTRTLALREERPQEQSVTITIANKTGYSAHYMYISPAYSDTWGSDVLGSSEILRNKASRRVTLPPLNTARRYDIKLRDKDGDTYTKWNVEITPNMTITFTILDIDL
jgi:hypothetical protein